MASVTLTDLWLHDSTDLTDSIQIPLNTLAEMRGKVEGKVTRYAGGRLREVRRVGDADSYTISLVMVPVATYDKLVGWSGTLLLMRGPKGRLTYGVYHNISGSEQAGPTGYVRSVQFRLDEITKTAEV